jgi:hypothetical protein
MLATLFAFLLYFLSPTETTQGSPSAAVIGADAGLVSACSDGTPVPPRK